MKTTLVVLSLLGLCLVASPAGAAPIVIGGVSYAEVTPTEVLTASFLTPTGGTTSSLYSDFVRIDIEGTGESFGSALNDAFYLLAGPTNHATFYQATMDTSPLVGSIAVPVPPIHNLKHQLYFDIDAGVEVTPTYVPAYRADHRYSVVANTGSAIPSLLYFGVNDGNFGDNAGAYVIRVTQLAPVPEPAGLSLVGAGALLLGWGVRRRRRR